MKIAVIGGGAAGLCAAISAARGGAAVTVFERNDRVGKKILMTGNGKCNLSNIEMSESYYYCEDSSFIKQVLTQFDENSAQEFFRSLGLLLMEKRGGIYPYNEQASAVLDALRFEIARLGIELITECLVDEIIPLGELGKASGFTVRASDGKMYKAFDRVIVACGGKAAPKTGSDGLGYSLAKRLGHKINPVFPSLVALKCDGTFWKSIAGVRAYGAVSIFDGSNIIATDKGELQLTDYGISGIPVFQVSHVASELLLQGKKCYAQLDFVPDIDVKTFEEELKARYLLVSDRDAESFFGGILNKKLSTLLLKKCNIGLNERLKESDICKLSFASKNFQTTVVETAGFEHAQVSGGGIRTSELTGDFESKICKGLYFCGEIIDVDGLCGGYNLQFAWASGNIAGKAAALC